MNPEIITFLDGLALLSRQAQKFFLVSVQSLV